MNRIVDDPDGAAEGLMRGVLAARPELLAATDYPRLVRRAALSGMPRAAVMVDGESGHDSASSGYLSPGLVEAVAIGGVFAAPAAPSAHAAFRAEGW